MKKQTLLIIGLIGGILVTVGVFLPWASAFGIDVSGWDRIDEVSEVPYVALMLIGGIIALLGALVSAGAVKMKHNYPVLLGGILAIIAWIWAAADIDRSMWTYGLYTCLIGAILALIGGIGVRAKK